MNWNLLLGIAFIAYITGGLMEVNGEAFKAGLYPEYFGIFGLIFMSSLFLVGYLAGNHQEGKKW